VTSLVALEGPHLRVAIDVLIRGGALGPYTETQ